MGGAGLDISRSKLYGITSQISLDPLNECHEIAHVDDAIAVTGRNSGTEWGGLRKESASCGRRPLDR